MPKKVLLKSEKVLICLAFIVVTASIILALCVGFLIPPNWIDYRYASNISNLSEKDMTAICHCNARRYTTDIINCIPRSFKDSILNLKPINSIPYCEKEVMYPYLVALHVPAYSDDNKERRLACTGTIVSTLWILTGQDCIYPESELKFLRVRAGSMHWSKGGTEHRPTSFSKPSDDGPIAYKVDPEFKFDKLVKAVTIPEGGKQTTWVSATTAWWRQESIRKFEKLVVQTWSTRCDNCNKKEVTGNRACNNNFIEKILVTKGNLLIGIYSTACRNRKPSKSKFINLQNEDYQSWLSFLTGKSNESVPPVKSLNATREKPVKIYVVNECVQPTDTTDVTTGTAVISNQTTLNTNTGETDTTVKATDTVNSSETITSEVSSLLTVSRETLVADQSAPAEV